MQASYGEPLYYYYQKRGRVDRVVLTGKTRKRNTCRGLRHGLTMHQYRCLDCDHVGYSSHDDMERFGRLSPHCLPSCCDGCKNRDGLRHDPPCEPEQGDGEGTCADWIKAKKGEADG